MSTLYDRTGLDLDQAEEAITSMRPAILALEILLDRMSPHLIDLEGDEGRDLSDAISAARTALNNVRFQRFALCSPQGTACPETVLTAAEFADPEWRRRIEKQFCRGGPDDPVAGEWADVTDNEACA